MADTLVDICNNIARALQMKHGTTRKYKPTEFATNILSIGANLTAKSTDIVQGKTAYVGNDVITGTFAPTSILITPTGKQIIRTPATGKYFNSVEVAGDDRLIASNIRKGVTIYGVTGTYGTEVNKLDTPVITMNANDYLSWNAVSNVDHYKVVYTNVKTSVEYTEDVSANSTDVYVPFSLEDLAAGYGTYKITVHAIAGTGYIDSDVSNVAAFDYLPSINAGTYTFVSEPIAPTKRLSCPTGFKFFGMSSDMIYDDPSSANFCDFDPSGGGYSNATYAVGYSTSTKKWTCLKGLTAYTPVDSTLLRTIVIDSLIEDVDIDFYNWFTAVTTTDGVKTMTAGTYVWKDEPVFSAVISTQFAFTSRSTPLYMITTNVAASVTSIVYTRSDKGTIEVYNSNFSWPYADYKTIVLAKDQLVSSAFYNAVIATNQLVRQ